MFFAFLFYCQIRENSTNIFIEPIVELHILNL